MYLLIVCFAGTLLYCITLHWCVETIKRRDIEYTDIMCVRVVMIFEYENNFKFMIGIEIGQDFKFIVYLLL